MIQPRWHKVLLDLWSNKTRTILVVLSISVGVFAIGLVSGMYFIFLHDLDAEYQSVNPHQATIYTSQFDDTLLQAAQRVPGVSQVEGRSSMTARIEVTTGQWLPINLTAIPPLGDIQMDMIRPDTIMQVLGDHDVYIERSSVGALNVKPGGSIQVESPNKTTRELRVTGIVHDVTAFPVSLSGLATAYVSPATMEWLGGSRDPNVLYMTVADNPGDEDHVKSVAHDVSVKVEKSGRQVYATIVYKPGEHPVRSASQALLMVLAILGILLVFLSGFLVINTIAALLSQHIRQIGVMKAVGARTAQITLMYFVLVTLLGLVALLISIPLGGYLGYGLSAGMARFFNFDLEGFRIPTGTIIMQTSVALLVPLSASVYPILHGTHITVREAISSYGMGRGQFGTSFIDKVIGLLSRLPLLSRPLLISLRNTFRRKARLTLTLSTLTLAGAIFIGVLNLGAAFNQLIDETLGYILSDINVGLNRAYRTQQIQEVAKSVPGIDRLEGWVVSTGQVLSNDKISGVDVQLLAPPANSTLIKPVLTSGRWLLPADENAIVIGNHMVNKRPDLKVGDDIIIKISGKEYTWHIVGVFRLAGNVVMPILYTNGEYLASLLDQAGRASTFRVVTKQHDAASQAQAARTLEQKLRDAGISVGQVLTGADEVARQASTTNILVYFLLVMALMIAMVGGIGLMGTMSMNVLERTREIGVLRSIGASNGAILRLVIVEGLLIGIISWVIGSVLSIPLGRFMSDVVGVAFVGLPLPFVFSTQGLLIWLIIVLVLSGLASILPALNAVRLTVRDVLAYE
jgi:putative ABC transport system permease protein